MGIPGGNACCSIETAVKNGRFRRRSDGQSIQRYKCKKCKKTFSQATFDPAYYQKKRHMNFRCLMALASTMSQRRAALVLNLNKKTVAKKLRYVGEQCRLDLEKDQEKYTQLTEIQFDELHTFEHTKCKPLSVAKAVSGGSRKIHGFRVSVMPATGHLAAISRRKYGPRADNRIQGMATLFEDLQGFLPSEIHIKSDECPFYKSVVERYFPTSNYCQFKGQKSSSTGQGELKKIRRDPLFAINHTFAMLRANINRLLRKTWCTTKKITGLIDHLYIYAWVHNNKLTKTPELLFS